MPDSASLQLEINLQGLSAHTHTPEAIQRVVAAFETFRMPVYRYLLIVTGSPAESEDIAQECFLRFYRQLSGGGAVNDARLWLFAVAHNLAIDRRRTGRLEFTFDAPAWTDLVEKRSSSGPNPEQALIQKERYLALRQVLGLLSATEHSVLHLRSEGLRYKEIAEVLGLGTSTVADTLHRAIGKLKAALNA